MESLTSLYILAPLFANLAVQLFKFVRHSFSGDTDLRYLFMSGGMPSGHSATAAALTVTTGILQGISSPLFGVVAVFSTIVVYDCMGISHVHDQENGIFASLVEKLGKEFQGRALTKMHLKKILGHKPSEVLAGLTTGAVVALMFTYQTWSPHVQFLFEAPAPAERMTYLVIAAVLTAGSLLSWVIYSSKKYRKLATAETLKKLVFWSLFTAGLLNSLFVVAEYQTLPLTEDRFWPLLTYALLILFHLGAWQQFYQYAPERLAQERKERKKLEKQRQRRRKKK